MERRGRKSAAQTPAPKKDRIIGSKKNPKGSAASKSSASKIELSESITNTLEKKRDEYNAKHPNSKVNLSTLKAVFRRGAGAYSNSYRPTITGGKPNSRSAWAFARVNKFLLKKGGTKVKAAYVQDDDLMEKGGQIGEEVNCRNCGWEWNTKDSEEFDKYVCHQCGFDNSYYYDSNQKNNFQSGAETQKLIALPDAYSTYENLKPLLAKQGYQINEIKMDIPVGKLAKGKNLSQVATMHGMKAEDLIGELALGVKTETEHTSDLRIARAIALDHLVEDPEYYTNLLKMETNMEADKLKDYYKNGGELAGISCQILDKNGERDISPEAIKTLTECVMSLPQTKTMHFDYEANDYKPYRKRLHKDIIYEFKKDLVCVDNENPIAILMGGSPASGKSTFLKKYAPFLLKEEIFKIDADEIRAKLPEYKGFNAAQTHMETKDIVATLLSDRNIGMPCTFDVIYDGTMNNTKSYIPLIYLLKSIGYKVFIVYIDRVPKDVVVNRSLERYKKQGRFVPLEVIDDFFGKGKEALEQLKREVDGYMIVDGSNTTYEVIEQGGEKIPQDRNYSKIGEPIKITSEDVIREFKKGGQIDPDNSQIKDAITHKSGEAGGLLVGKRHSEGGIKAVNKSTGQPLEMEGGEVVITRDAVSDNEKREFEGEMLTNRQILSRINESGGGVSFADGGDIPSKCACSGKSYNYGGKLMADNEIIESIMGAYKKATDFDADKLIEPSELNKKLFSNQYFKDGGFVYEEGGLIAIANKQVPSLPEFSKRNLDIIPIGMKKAYSDYLKRVYKFDFNGLPHLIQSGLILGSQKLVDKYINGK